jgi:hypothetical protein
MMEIFCVLKIGSWAILQIPIDYGLEVTFKEETTASTEAREEAFGQVDLVKKRWIKFQR